MQAQPVNGPEERVRWSAVDWRQVNRCVRNLRRRIFRASRENDHRKLRSLQKLMLRSRANALKSVRLGVRPASLRNFTVAHCTPYRPWERGWDERGEGVLRCSCLDRIGQDEGGHGAVDEIDAVGDDMPTLQRPDMSQMRVLNDHATGAQLGDDALHLQGVP